MAVGSALVRAVELAIVRSRKAKVGSEVEARLIAARDVASPPRAERIWGGAWPVASWFHFGPWGS